MPSNNKRSFGIGFTTAVCLYAAAAQGQTLPAPFEADYSGSKQVFNAKAKIALSREGDYYKYTMRSTAYVAAFYKLTELYDCSIIRITGDKLYPLEYVHQDNRNPRRDTHVRFDWGKRTVHTRLGDGAEQKLSGLKHPAWDIMSLHVGMMKDIATADRNTKFNYMVVERGKLVDHRAKIEGEGMIEVNAYRLRAVKVAEGDKSIFWFATEHALLPVRITINGVSLDLASPPEQARRPSAPVAATTPGC